jgi:hypothetical protein
MYCRRNTGVETTCELKNVTVHKKVDDVTRIRTIVLNNCGNLRRSLRSGKAY